MKPGNVVRRLVGFKRGEDRGETLFTFSFNRVVEFDPQIPWAYFNRGLAKVYLGRDKEAQTDFDECLRMRPEIKADLDARIDLARQLRRIGNSQE